MSIALSQDQVALAESVHAHGYKVALTGEGSDEWLAGYPWFKLHRVLGWLDVVPALRRHVYHLAPGERRRQKSNRARKAAAKRRAWQQGA